MTVKDQEELASRELDADEALATVIERLSGYVVVEPRDTSFPVPLFGVLSTPSRVQIVERSMSAEDARARIWERVGSYFWSILPHPEELMKRAERDAE